MDHGDQISVQIKWIKELAKHFFSSPQDWEILKAEMETLKMEEMKSQLAVSLREQIWQIRMEFEEKFETIMSCIAKVEKKSKDELELDIIAQKFDELREMSSTYGEPKAEAQETEKTSEKADEKTGGVVSKTVAVKDICSSKTQIIKRPSTAHQNQPKKMSRERECNSNIEKSENFNFKIATWNLTTIKKLNQRNSDYIQLEDPDIIVTFNGTHSLVDEVHNQYKPDIYPYAYWNISKGFDGVKILSKNEAISSKYDLPDSNPSDEKRSVIIEFEKFYVISIYIVNAGRGSLNLANKLAYNDAFYAHVKKLEKKKPVIITGNINISQREIEKNIGLTQEGRKKFTNSLSRGFVSDFRKLYPDQSDTYTFCSYLSGAPSRHVGWRLDYYLVSQRFMEHSKESVIRSDVRGSDHCPIFLLLNI